MPADTTLPEITAHHGDGLDELLDRMEHHMERCEHLERICEKIRKGELVSFLEAIAAINYQEQLKAEREAGRWYMRLWRRLRSNARANARP